MAHIYGLDPAAQEHVKTATGLAAQVLVKHAAEVDAKGRFPTEGITALRKARLTGLCIDGGLGGLGQGPRAFAGVAEELATACASSAMVFVMHVSAQQAIASSKTLATRDAVLKEIARGDHLTTLAFSEKGSRSHFWAPTSKLTERDGGYVTQALKSWVTSASEADSYVSSAQQPGAKSPLESTIYLLKKGQAGVRVSGGFDGMGLRGNDSAPVTLEDVKVRKDELISANGSGADTMLQVVLPWFSIGTAAMAHGLCRSAIAATAAHLSSAKLEHTGQALRDLPNLRARLAQMSVRTEQSRALLGYTLGEMEKPNEMTPLFVLQSRLSALETAVEVTDLAMKTCGGAAFSKQLGVERQFRDARAGWVMAPTADHLEDFVGKALTGLPLF
jgi:alkylation response protein AidB-like acyl-CoA dehydrogenase